MVKGGVFRGRPVAGGSQLRGGGGGGAGPELAAQGDLSAFRAVDWAPRTLRNATPVHCTLISTTLRARRRGVELPCELAARQLVRLAETFTMLNTGITVSGNFGVCPKLFSLSQGLSSDPTRAILMSLFPLLSNSESVVLAPGIPVLLKSADTATRCTGPERDPARLVKSATRHEISEPAIVA